MGKIAQSGLEKNNIPSKSYHSTILYVILCYYAITYIFYVYRIHSFLKDIIIAPLFFLVPAGIGLLLLSLFSAHKKILKFVNSSQLLLSSIFLGFLLIAFLYAELNNTDNLTAVFSFVYPTINLLSLYGFYKTRHIYNLNKDIKHHIKSIIVLTPVFALLYYFYFMHFSEYPLRDIYQEVHFMKGATEFAKYNILNIATAGSYFPLYQVHFGLLNHFYNYNLINSQWIMPFYIFIFQYLCFKGFYDVFIKDKKMLLTACVISLLLTSITVTTNYAYLVLFTLVLFSILVSKNRDKTKIIPVILELLCFIGIFFFFYKNKLILSDIADGKTLFPYLIIINLFTVIIASCFNANRVLSFSFVSLLLLIAPSYHKVAALYIPVVLIMYAVYFLLYQWEYLEDKHRKAVYLTRFLPYWFLLILVGVIVINFFDSPREHLENFLMRFYFLFGGDGGYSPISFLGVLSEWFRLIPPLVHAIILSFIFYIMFAKTKNKEDNLLIRKPDWNFLAFCSLVLPVFVCLVFLPLPHIYRVSIYPAVLIAGILAFVVHFDKLLSRLQFIKPFNALFFILAILITIFALKFVYFLSWDGGQIKNHYIISLSPLSEILAATMIACIIFVTIRSKPAMSYIMIFIVFVSGIALDKFMITAKLYENCYPYSNSQPRIISHYSLLELNTAVNLNTQINKAEFLFISDPYTLGIFSAVTGINGLYSFSNLGLMKKSYEDSIKYIVRNAFPNISEYNKNFRKDHIKNFKSKNKMILALLSRYFSENAGAFPEAEYIIRTKLRKSFNYDLFKNKTIWILNKRTIEWAYGKIGYYPKNERFSYDYIEKNILPFFNIIYNADNRIFVLTLK